MNVLRISSLTNEYYRVPVEAFEGGTAVNPTTDVVAFAFKTSGAPVLGDFTAGSWDTAGANYFARIRVGGTGSGATKELAVGRYTVWVKITDSPEVPVREVGILEVV